MRVSRLTATMLATVGLTVFGLTRAEAAIYSVSTTGSDSSAGTLTQPFRTVSRGLGALRAGDTLYIRGGTYTELLFEIYFGSGGTSWSNPVTVAAYPGETVTLPVFPGGDNVIRFQDGSVSYVVIDGLVIDGTGGAAMSSLVSLGPKSHHIRLGNVEIKNAQNNGVIAGGNSHEFINLSVHDSGLWSGYSTGSNGMYMFTTNSVVSGGQFYNNECYGIRFMDSDPAASADNNTVRGSRVYNNGYGKGLSGASICGSSGGGILLGDVNNIAYNNLVYGNFVGMTAYTGSKTASQSKFYNNTVYNNIVGIQIFAGTRYAEAINNIVYLNNSGIVDTAVGSVLSNNLSTDPMFLDAQAAEFALQPGSPAVDKGKTISVVLDDFGGGLRPSGNGYDIGAYEFSSRPTQPRHVRALPQ